MTLVIAKATKVWDLHEVHFRNDGFLNHTPVREVIDATRPGMSIQHEDARYR